MPDLSVELAAILSALGVDRIVVTAADILAAKSRSIYIGPSANGAMVIESRVRELTAPEQPRLFAVS